MISCHGIAKQAEASGILNRSHFCWHFFCHALEERRMVDISRVVIPSEKIAFGSLESIPSFVSCHSLTVVVFEQRRGDDFVDNFLDFSTTDPDVFKPNVFTFFVLTDWLLAEVDIDSASKSVGNNERRACKIVCSSKRMDTSFEVSVS